MTIRKWAEAKNGSKSEKQATINAKVEEVMEALPERTLVTYNWLAHQVEECIGRNGQRDIRKILNSVKQMEMDKQMVVVDREELIPGRGFWKGLQTDNGLENEQVDELREALAEKHLGWKLEDVAPKGKKSSTGDMDVARAAMGLL